jgi:hypothetical protein
MSATYPKRVVRFDLLVTVLGTGYACEISPFLYNFIFLMSKYFLGNLPLKA